VDRLFQRPSFYVGGHKDGSKGNHFMPDRADSPVPVLCRRVSCFALVSLHLSADPVEPDKDSYLSSSSGGGNAFGMLCKSCTHAAIYPYALTLSLRLTDLQTE